MQHLEEDFLDADLKEATEAGIPHLGIYYNKNFLHSHAI